MIIGVVQVSMGSQRLRGKALLPILGKPMTWWVYTRLRQAKLLDNVVLAFPEDDTSLRNFAVQYKIPYYAGSYRDLIDRLYSAAITYRAAAIVYVCGDCPMVDPDIVDTLVASRGKADYVVNSWPSSFPEGLGLSVLSVKLLRELWEEIQDPIYREWFLTYLKQHRNRFQGHTVLYKGESLNSLRWTVDYPEDLEFVRCIYDRLGGDFRMRDVLDLLEQEPELSKINERKIDPYHNFPYKEE